MTNAEAASVSLAIWLDCGWSLPGRTSSQSNPLYRRDEMNFLAGTRTGEMRPIGSNVDEAELRTHLVNVNDFPWKL